MMSHIQSSVPIGAIAADYVRQFTTRRRSTRSGSEHRTGAPVRRDSLEAGTFEDTFFTALAPGEADRLRTMLDKAADKAPHLLRRARAGEKLSVAERAIAAITAPIARVGKAMLEMARLQKGQVYPSYDWLAANTGHSRGTIAKAISVLEGHVGQRSDAGSGGRTLADAIGRHIDKAGHCRVDCLSHMGSLVLPASHSRAQVADLKPGGERPKRDGPTCF